MAKQKKEQTKSPQANAGKNSGSEAGKRSERQPKAAGSSGSTPPRAPAKLVNVSIKTHNDRNGGHPHVIIDDIDDKHVSVGLTHDKKKGKNSTNAKLTRNPLGGKKNAYMHRQGTVDSKKSYHGKREGKMSQEDYDKAKGYAEKAKRKYIAKKDKKK